MTVEAIPRQMDFPTSSLFTGGTADVFRLFENLPIPVVIGTLEKLPSLVFMNREYVRLFGYEQHEVPTIAEWMPLAYPDPVYRAEILEWWFQALGDSKSESSLVRSREVRIRAKSGKQIEAILSAIVMAKYVIVSFQDITGRKQREMELEKSNARMQLAAEAAKVGFWEYDFLTESNNQDAQTLEIYGVTPDVPFGKWENHLHPEDRSAAENRIDAALARGDSGLDLEFRTVHPDGKIRWVRSRCRITRDATGQPLRLTGIDCDITAEKTAQIALEESLARAERESEAKGRFLTSVSHEIRTPLSALVALTNSMLLESEQHPLPDVFHEHLESVRAGGQYLNLMLANILDLSAIERGNSGLRPVEFYLADWAEDVSSILSPIAKSHGVHLEWMLPDDRDALFATDPFRLTQIVLNLGHNAVKFSTGFHAVVLIGASVIDGRLALTVSDNGPGIDPERLPELFNEFEQGGGSSRSGERGVGLGLAIVKRNAELLGGSISARANTPKGMRFEMEIPRMDGGTGSQEAG